MARPEHDAPEIARVDLAETALEIFGASSTPPDAFEWFEAPPPAALAAAETLLQRLGAVAERRITPTGRRMLELPVHPRQARMVVEAERRGVARDGAVIAALVGERDIRSSGPRFSPGPRTGPRTAGSTSDLVDLLAAFERAEDEEFAGDRVRALGLDVGRVMDVDRIARRLTRGKKNAPGSGSKARTEALRMTILAGYPDRVGRLRRPEASTGRTGTEVVFASGGTAILDDDGSWDTPLLVAVDVEERTEERAAARGRPGAERNTRTMVRIASAVEPDWLLDLFTEEIRDETDFVWNAEKARVELVRRLSFDGLVLEESRQRGGDAAGVSQALARAARAAGWRRFVDAADLERWQARVAFLAKSCPELGIRALDDAAIFEVLDGLCEGRSSFAELRDADLMGALRGSLSGEQARALAELAPEAVTLPGGRRTRIDYSGDAPSIASRLQDFFGLAKGPAVARGRVPLVLHLLAPNQRAVQVTTDLAGFWARHYPAIARELRRRYPRHAWPDDPLTASPPARRP